MRRITLLLVAFAVAVISTTQVSAQKVDPAAVTKSLEKQDAAIAHPKKSLKAATWLKHADTYYASIKDPLKPLFVGAKLAEVKTLYGKSKDKKQKIAGKNMVVSTYGYVTIYSVGGNIVAWKPTKFVKKGAMEVATKSYIKAMEIDPAAKVKAEAGLKRIADHYKELGNVSNTLEAYADAAGHYLSANKVIAAQTKKSDAKLVYNAASLYLRQAGINAKNAKFYGTAEKQFRAAIKAGYNKLEKADDKIKPEDKGGIYHYIYYCVVKSAAEPEEKRLIELKNLLVKALKEYPDNINITNDLMSLYASYPNIGTPEEVLAMIEEALVKNPDNISGWFNRGRIYSGLKNNEECIKSFSNVVRIDPNNFNGHLYVGIFTTSKADEFQEEMRAKTYTKQADYDADFATLCSKYKLALPSLEKAHELKPDSSTPVEYLKSIYFRIREEEGMMEKYNKYNELQQSMAAAREAAKAAEAAKAEEAAKAAEAKK